MVQQVVFFLKKCLQDKDQRLEHLKVFSVIYGWKSGICSFDAWHSMNCEKITFQHSTVVLKNSLDLDF